MSTLFFTACTRNYLARTRLLADSVQRHHPGARFAVGLSDSTAGLEGSVDLSGVEVVPADTIGIPGFEELLARYNVVEFCTATKPFYFQFFLRDDPRLERVVFLDPDTELLQPLSAYLAELDEANVVLTPQLHAPPDDADRERRVMRAGIYNSGMLAVSRSDETERFLAWWGSRLAEVCYENVQRGMFVDQLVLNQAPIYFDGVAIHHDPGLNVSWWNLGERSIARRDGAWFVDGDTPLTLFHFSRYDPCSLAPATRFAESSRARLPDATLELLEDYGRRLLLAGHASVWRLPWAWRRPGPPATRSPARRIASLIRGPNRAARVRDLVAPVSRRVTRPGRVALRAGRRRLHRLRKLSRRLRRRADRWRLRARVAVQTRFTREVETHGIRVGIDRGIGPEMRDALFSGTYLPEATVVGRHLEPGDRVMEFGGGLGVLSAFCALRVGSENVFSYEGHPALEARIRDTWRRNDVSPSLTPALVGERDGTRALHLYDNTWSSSVVPSGRPRSAVRVPMKSFNDEVRKLDPSFVMVDIEGGEHEMAQYADWHRVRKLLLEIHPFEIGQEATDAVLERLARAGFEVQDRLDRILYLTREP